MPRILSAQMTELGDDFLALAQAVGNYRMENRPMLSKSQNLQIKDLHWTLLSYADDFYTGSVKLVMDEIQSSLARIREISININKTIKKLQNFQKAIDIAAAAVTLASAIFSKNPVAINKAIEAFEKSIKP